MPKLISSIYIAAVGFWIVGLALIVVDLIAPDIHTDALGLYFAGIGGVLTVRGTMCEGRALEERRERNAFEVGRDCSSSGEVRPLR